MSKERPSQPQKPEQMAFLRPEDAELLHKGRIALAELAALYEMRQAKRMAEAVQIRHPEDAFEYFRFEMEPLEQEQMRVLSLNRKNRVISAQMIYQGSVHTTVIRLAELFRPAILDNATGILVAHNHPSGDPQPSPEDVALTRELAKAGRLLDIDLLDHIAIGQGVFVSLKERRLGFDK